MFIDYTKYQFLNSIVEKHNIIANEFMNAAAQVPHIKRFVNEPEPEITNHVMYWIKDNKFHPDDIGYEAREGLWAAFPLYKSGFPILWYDLKKFFPETLKLLKDVPNLNFAAFMRLDAGAKTTAHKHLMKNNIFHLLLNDLNAPCEFIVSDEKKVIQKKGDALMFNYSNTHESINLSSNNRFNLVVDFDPFLCDLEI